MSTGRRIDRRAPVPKGVLMSLRQSYATANEQAAALMRAYAKNTVALIDLQGEIARGADRANDIVLRAQTRADDGPF
jgi:hypothetical protein